MLSMRWANVLLIFRREVRDQIRDRRTLFMIFVLPILLYPILGLGSLKLAEAIDQKLRRVVVLGAEYLPAAPRLLDASRENFEPSLFELRGDAARMRVQREPADSPWARPEARRELLRAGQADVVVIIPRDVREQLARLERANVPIFYDSADEQSQTTYLRVDKILSRWNELIVRKRLEQDRKPETYTEPVRPEGRDIATSEEAGGSVWARILPFLLVMMSLTGAFYPAVDLCAGEKERGTMETLLISPATRAEIVSGKFLTILLASMATALLNLLSMGLTARGVAAQFGPQALGVPTPRAAMALTAPSLSASIWIVLLLVPLSAFFSALCLSLAVLARSMKEGQYYMTPLYLVALPLVFATLVPGIELNLFTSLVPITGVSLLLRTLIQGDYLEARRFFLPVLLPLVVYGLVALRWAVDQFQRESVLFREAERVDVAAYLRHILRDKLPTPSAGQALLCFALMITAAWFLQGFTNATPRGMVASQVAFILAPPLVMAFLLTSSPRQTLLLSWPAARYLGLAVGLVLALNPLLNELRLVVESLFPIPELIKAELGKLMGQLPDYPTALLVLAVVPGVCEEVAFRGFILSGLRRNYRSGTAILLSAFLFGFLHVLLSLFHQLFNATLLGIVLGLLAVRSRSLLPGIVFHVANNALAVALGGLAAGRFGQSAAVWLFRNQSQGLYHVHWVVLGGLIAAALMVVLLRDAGTTSDKPSPVASPLSEAVSETVP
jgi:sodium transport system permease protein